MEHPLLGNGLSLGFDHGHVLPLSDFFHDVYFLGVAVGGEVGEEWSLILVALRQLVHILLQLVLAQLVVDALALVSALLVEILNDEALAWI